MSPFFENPTLYRSVLENLPTGIYVLDREQRVRFWNRGAEAITGFKAHEVTGKIVGESFPHFDPKGRVLAGEYSPVTTTLRDGRASKDHVFALHKEGHRLRVQVRTMPLLDDDGLIMGVAIEFDEHPSNSGPDFSEALMYGCLDPLTGVPSRRLTGAVVAESLAALNTTQGQLALLHIRITGIQELLDRCGADSTAAFLRTAAQTIRHSLSPNDFFGRWSENEFMAVLHSANTVKLADMAERIVEQVSASEISWWGDRFRLCAVVARMIAAPGDKLETLLSQMRLTQPAPVHGGDARGSTSRG